MYESSCKRNASDTCPADLEAIAESYFMGTIHDEDLVVFEDHCWTCERCVAVVGETERYVLAMRAAARRLR